MVTPEYSSGYHTHPCVAGNENHVSQSSKVTVVRGIDLCLNHLLRKPEAVNHSASKHLQKHRTVTWDWVHSDSFLTFPSTSLLLWIKNSPSTRSGLAGLVQRTSVQNWRVSCDTLAHSLISRDRLHSFQQVRHDLIVQIYARGGTTRPDLSCGGIGKLCDGVV